MLQKAKEAIVSADSRTKGILAMAVVYVVIMLATVSSGAVNQITDFIPTVDIRFKRWFTGGKRLFGQAGYSIKCLK